MDRRPVSLLRRLQLTITAAAVAATALVVIAPVTASAESFCGQARSLAFTLEAPASFQEPGLHRFEWREIYLDEEGNPVEYPAALLQPVGSKGRGGWGLSIGATTKAGRRASFSNSGSWISLVAPGEDVFGAISSYSKTRDWPRYALPGSSHGLFGFASGTSFAAPQVAGAAALVWAANPALGRDQVAWILKHTASGNGRWTRGLGYGVLDVGRAVATAANGGDVAPPARADAALKLIGPRRRMAKRIRLRIQGVLRSKLPAISPAGRRVSLQIRHRGGWFGAARTSTKAGGRVLLRTRLRPGRYVMRVRYPGAPELSEATSRTFVMKVPRRKHR